MTKTTAAEKIGLQVPEIFLPAKEVDLHKWAVIACDQFTSQPEYWERVEKLVGDEPSTYHLILPEAILNRPEKDQRIEYAQKKMAEYLEAGILQPHQGFVLVERSLGEEIQTGLLVALDLENYNYNKGSQSLIRATEGTILDRLPPRIRVRRGAPLELPHILVLYDDPNMSVLKEVLENKQDLPLAYDFDLMEGSGHIRGHLIKDEHLINTVIDNLANLIEPEQYQERYGDLREKADSPLLFAVGDGNHSLATAKAIWEELKPEVSMDHPARFALVELVNLHDTSLNFEAIHRVLFNVDEQFAQSMADNFGANFTSTPCTDFEEMKSKTLQASEKSQRFGLISSSGYFLIDLFEPKHNLSVANLQEFLDKYLQEHPDVEIDYVHGDDVLDQLARQEKNVGFFLAPITKNNFFKTVIVDGSLPRKTFSMGHAKDKRFYLEARKIL